MIAPTELRLVLVTPEKTLLDTPVRSVRFPLFDGQFGVLPGRAPVVGRLGQGELRFESGSTTEQYYIEGGFVQIKGGVVTLLTSRAVAVEDINPAAAEQALQAALAKVATTPADQEEKQRVVTRNRSMLSLKRF
jgi:F-type H+-transporting ATPase subunit epsilon